MFRRLTTHFFIIASRLFITCGLISAVELDGGIDTTTALLGVAARADVLVAGSAIFNHDDGVATGMKHLQAALLRASMN